MSTAKPYRGVNVFLLSPAAQDAGWTSPWFGKYGQIHERGGQVRQGEKSTLVTFWKTLEKEDHDPATGQVSTTTVPMLRQFRVFNACQAVGIPATAARMIACSTSAWSGSALRIAFRIALARSAGPRRSVSGDPGPPARAA